MRKNSGGAAEEAAVLFLEGKGIRILERNFRSYHGEIDIIAQLPAASASLFSDTDTYTIGAATSTRSQFLQFNLESEALKDVNIRKAISMCIDREGYADVVFAGYAKPMIRPSCSATIYGYRLRVLSILPLNSASDGTSYSNEIAVFST